MKHSRRLVTNHAMIRYLAEVEGMDVDGLCARIRNKVDAGMTTENGAVVESGFAYTLRDGIVTCVAPELKQPKSGGRRAINNG